MAAPLPAAPPVPPVPLDELRLRGEAVAGPAGLRVRSPRTGQWLLVLALTDLDGTANDERVPEPARLATLGPARAAFARLHESGVATGICTARSLGEAREYRDALGIGGPIIAENGAVLVLPDGTCRRLGDAGPLAAVVAAISTTVGRPVPSSLDWPGLEAAWEAERQGRAPVCLGHESLAALRRAADRVASCFLVGLSPAEKEVATRLAAAAGLDAFGDLLHLVARPADKGLALGELLDTLRPSDSAVVVPIVFGNGVNDLPLFARALRAGGAAVLVGDVASASGFHFDPVRHPVPAGTITVPGVSHGPAILRSLPRIADFFAGQYGFHFPWEDEGDAGPAGPFSR